MATGSAVLAEDNALNGTEEDDAVTIISVLRVGEPFAYNVPSFWRLLHKLGPGSTNSVGEMGTSCLSWGVSSVGVLLGRLLTLLLSGVTVAIFADLAG